MESTLTRRGLNGNQLKLIAITAMTIDHLAWTLWPGYSHNPAAIACHIMGRLTAPIMWFFIVEGYHYTHDVNKYTLRLFILALVSHFAYNFCFGISFVPLKDGVFNQTSVAWSLAWGLVLLRINDSKRLPHWLKAVIVFAVCAITFPSDWSCVAAVAILFMGSGRGLYRCESGSDCAPDQVCARAQKGIVAEGAGDRPKDGMHRPGSCNRRDALLHRMPRC